MRLMVTTWPCCAEDMKSLLPKSMHSIFSSSRCTVTLTGRTCSGQAAACCGPISKTHAAAPSNGTSHALSALPEKIRKQRWRVMATGLIWSACSRSLRRATCRAQYGARFCQRASPNGTSAQGNGWIYAAGVMREHDKLQSSFTLFHSKEHSFEQ